VRRSRRQRARVVHWVDGRVLVETPVSGPPVTRSENFLNLSAFVLIVASCFSR